MKLKFLIGLIIVLFISPIYAQQVTNSDFEQWSGDNALDWTGSISVSGFTFKTAAKSNDSHSGDYAAKLETKAILTGDVVPGMIQLGSLDIATLQPVGGIPFTAKPTAFEVFFKYNQQANDSVVVFAYLSKYNPVTKQSVKIGGAYLTYDEPVEEYTSFLIPIYYLEEGTPDTINIGFFSSNQTPHEGSVLWVDDLTLLYGNYLLAPQADNPQKVKSTSFVAKWTGADYTNSYYLDVASNPEFTDFLPGYKNLNVGDTTEITVSFDNPEVKKIYYRVRADYDSVISESSNVISFFVPYAPECYEPVNLSSKSFTARWQELPLANYYIFDVSRDSMFTDLVDNYYFNILTSTSSSVVGLLPLTDYYYRVRAMYDLSIKSVASNVIKVTTPPDTGDEEYLIFTQKHKIVIFSDSTLFDSQLYLYSIDGKRIWNGKVSDRYTEIPINSSQFLILNIIKADGNIIRKKFGIVTPSF